MYRQLYFVGDKYLPPAVVEASNPNKFPLQLTRLGKSKMEFFIRQIVQLEPRERVLELFGGTGLGTVLLAQRLVEPQYLVSIDIHYSFMLGQDWRYLAKDNYEALATYYGVKKPSPCFLGQDARELPHPANMFDVVVAADSPRTAWNRLNDARKTAGLEWKLEPSEQRDLFVAAAHEAHRVLLKGGRFYATAPQSWAAKLPFSKIKFRQGPAQRLQFAPCEDRVVYISAEK